MSTIAFFDDFTDTVLGHHPDFIVGLANALPELDGRSDTGVLYCPSSFVDGHRLNADVDHYPMAGKSPASGAEKVPYAVDPANVSTACRDAVRRGATVFLNCFFDENHPAWPVPEAGLRFVHTLHRPGWFATEAAGPGPGAERRLAALIDRVAPSSLFVVHSAQGERQASRFVDPRVLVRAGWPTASRAEVAERFARSAAPAGHEPYVLSIGSARADKGIDWLLTALADGPPLRIVGQQYDGVQARLTDRYPDTRISWETGWVSRAGLGEAIRGAAVVVFPYVEQFTRYGGASGALAQALTFGKPVVVSEALADQVPTSEAHTVILYGDVRGLRRAIDRTIRESRSAHEAAAAVRAHIEREHTYEAHLERVLDRLPMSPHEGKARR